MSNRRLLKAAEAIREVVAAAILTELRDPRVKDVTVISVQVTPDMREAKVAVSVMGDDKHQQLCIRGLQNSAGFLQAKVANRIELRYTPKLRFVLDKGQQNAMVVGELLEQLRREREGEPLSPSGEQSDEAEDANFSEDPSAESTGDAPDVNTVDGDAASEDAQQGDESTGAASVSGDFPAETADSDPGQTKN